MSYSGTTLAVAAAIAFTAGGVTGAAFRRPAKTEFRDREVIKWRESEQQQHTTTIARVEGPKMRVIWHETTKTEPGGIVYVDRWHEREDTGPVETKAAEQTVLIREVAVDKIREVVKVETRTPTWMFGVKAGASLADPVIAIPGASWATLGASVDHSFIGDTRIGIYIDNRGAGLEFRW